MKTAKVIQTGNSLAVTIPAKFARCIGIKLGDEVVVDLNSEKGLMKVSFKSMRQLSLLR